MTIPGTTVRNGLGLTLRSSMRICLPALPVTSASADFPAFVVTAGLADRPTDI